MEIENQPPEPEVYPDELPSIPLLADPTRLYDLDAEAALLGAILIDEAQLAECETLEASAFHDHRHQEIWQAFRDLAEEGESIEYLTVCDALTRADKLKAIGGDSYITRLLNAPASSQSARYYARIIADYAARRRMLADAEAKARRACDLSIPLPSVVTECTPKTWADLGELCNVEFTWEGWLARGLLAILAGESGIGKSYLALRICGTFLLSMPWPDGTPFTGETGAVLWCESEAAQAVNLSRARAWGYPLDLIYTPLADPMSDISLDNPDHQAAITAKATLPEIKFITVDSLSGSSNRKESDTEIKRITEFLARLARDRQKPILLTHHLRKRGILDGNELTLDRLRGSSAIVQAARVIWGMDIPDPAHKDQIRLSQVKNNLRRFPEPMGMMITPEGEVMFGDAPNVPKQETQQERAADMLIAMLTPAPVRVVEIQSEMQQAGISWRTATLAKSHLKLNSVKKPDGWYWSLPV